jgi:F420H(2)-dependent quinone reductase
MPETLERDHQYCPTMSKPPPAASPFWRIAGLFARLDVALLRRTKGRRSLVSKAPTLVLHHVGRKSGRARTTPLIFLDNPPDLVIVASKGGADQHPAWYHNLMAMPATQVELPGRERRRVRPRLATEAERAQLWPRLVAIHRDYASYATYTDRTIPVVVLEPA